jgi:hypothetical protein
MDNNFLKPKQEKITNPEENGIKESDFLDYEMNWVLAAFLKRNGVRNLKELALKPRKEVLRFEGMKINLMEQLEEIMKDNKIDFKN